MITAASFEVGQEVTALVSDGKRIGWADGWVARRECTGRLIVHFVADREQVATYGDDSIARGELRRRGAAVAERVLKNGRVAAAALRILPAIRGRSLRNPELLAGAGLDYRVGEDAIWELLQSGVLNISPTSVISLQREPTADELLALRRRAIVAELPDPVELTCLDRWHRFPHQPGMPEDDAQRSVPCPSCAARPPSGRVPAAWDSDKVQPWLHVLEDSHTGKRYTVVLLGTYCGTANIASAHVAELVVGVRPSQLEIQWSAQVGSVIFDRTRQAATAGRRTSCVRPTS